VAASTACWADSSSLLEISFSALIKWVLVALLTDLFRSRFLSDARAAFFADLLPGNPASFLRTKTGFGLADSCGAYNTTHTLDFRQ